MYQPHSHVRIADFLGRHFSSQSPPTEFALRLAANFALIERLYRRLYGDHPNAEAGFERLLGSLVEAYSERNDSLRAIDHQREQRPDWLLGSHITGMSLYVDRFAKNLAGVREKLPYFEELGVNWLHLMPLFDVPEGSNDGGYAVRDFRTVAPRFGTMDQLRELAAEMHERGMFLTLDLVLNHTSDEHDWARRARAGEAQYQDFYYFFEDRRVPDRFEKSLPEVFPTSSPGNFTYVEEVDKWVMTVFHDYQWDLNYRNPEVFAEMLRVLLFLGNVGCDILRIDAPAFVWKEMGTDSQNLPEAHRILQLLKACAQVVAPGMAFIAEAIVSPEKIVPYFGKGEMAGRECEIAYNATFMALMWDALATRDTRLLTRGMRNVPRKPLGTTWINYARCHDDIGLGFDDRDIAAVGFDPAAHRRFLVEYYSGKHPNSDASGAPFMANPKTGDARISGAMAALAGLERARQLKRPHAIERAVRRIRLLHGLVLLYGGLPLLYYGDEVGRGNDFSYLDDPEKAYDNRWMHRPVMDWEAAVQRHEPNSVERRIFSDLQHLIARRKALPVLDDRNNLALEDVENAALFAFLRWREGGERLLVVANFSEHPQSLASDHLIRFGFQLSRGLEDAISEQKITPQDGRVGLAGYALVALREESQAV